MCRSAVEPRELDVGARGDRPVERVVELPADERLPVRPEHDLAGAAVVGEGMPGRRPAQLQHPPLVGGAAGEGEVRGPEGEAEPDRLDEEAGALDRVGEVERDDRLELAAPGVDLLVVEPGHEVGRMETEVPAGRRAADPAAQQERGRLDPAAGDDDERGLDGELDLGAAGVAGAGDDPRRATVGDDDPLGRAVDDEARAGVGRVLEVGLERRALVALLAAGVAVAAGALAPRGRREPGCVMRGCRVLHDSTITLRKNGKTAPTTAAA